MVFVHKCRDVVLDLSNITRLAGERCCNVFHVVLHTPGGRSGSNIGGEEVVKVVVVGMVIRVVGSGLGCIQRVC